MLSNLFLSTAGLTRLGYRSFCRMLVMLKISSRPAKAKRRTPSAKPVAGLIETCERSVQAITIPAPLVTLGGRQKHPNRMEECRPLSL